MRLGSASEHDVVRNATNGSFYRFARPERGRARIRPLEHFPNGRLIPKPTDTLVSADLLVALVGPWREGMLVADPPERARAAYAAELMIRRADLVGLEAAYELLPVNGKGKQSRGSWANKLKNCRSRIENLERGLEAIDPEEEVGSAEPEIAALGLRRRDVVLLPSGWPGQITGISVAVGAAPTAMVRTRHAGDGVLLTVPVPLEVLRPWSDSRLCTL